MKFKYRLRLNLFGTTTFSFFCRLFVVVFLFVIHGHAQPKIESPDVASLNKFIDQPVDKRTGIPSITIPIYTLQVAGYELPISLSYHAGGIKVEQESGAVGLGWSLNASSVISRSVMDAPDEGGYYGFGAKPTTPQSHTPDDPYAELGQATYSRDLRAEYDTEPDLFYFSIGGGYSGKFVIDKTTKIHLIPELDVRIEGDPSGGWRITDPNGTQYFFPAVHADQDFSAGGGVVTAWHLDQIVTVSLDTIQFEYIGQGYRMNKTLRHRTVPITVGAVYLGNGSDYNFGTIGCQQLSRIRSKKCDITFGYKDSRRLDFKAFTGGYYGHEMYALDNIQIIDNYTGSTINRFDFITSYFTGTGNQASLGEEEFLTKRLRLDGIVESGLPSYRFSYNKYNHTPGDVLPSRISRGQDVWGLYNGKDSNTGLFPKLTHPDIPSIVYIETGNDRQPNESYSMAFILDEVVHPTGSITSYLFEGVRDNLGSLIGGIRIKEIRSKASFGQPDKVRQYQYFNPYTIGGRYPKFTQNISDCIYGCVGSDAGICMTVARPPFTVMAFTSPAIMTASVASQYTFFEKIAEIQPGNGSVEYYYDLMGAQNEQADFDNDSHPTISTMPVLLGNDLLREVYRDVNGVIIKEIRNEYALYYRNAINANDAYKCFTICTGPEWYKYYGVTTGCSYLTKRSEYDYTEYPSKFILTTTDFEHKGIPAQPASGISYLHQFVTKETMRNSEGTLQIKYYKYPLDYKQEYTGYSEIDLWSPQSLAIKGLVDRWIIQNPIEEIVTVSKGGIEYISDGKLKIYESTTYSGTGKTQLNLKAVSNYEALLSPYTSSLNSKVVKDQNNVIRFQFDPGYKQKVIFDEYDSHGNLLELHNDKNFHTTFRWGYYHSVPIAQVQNASSSEFYYEGFEDSKLPLVVTNDEAGSHTGLRYYTNASYVVNWTKPNQKKYVLSYWVKQSGKWVNVEQPYTGATTLTTGNAYDDIKIYPEDAQAITYAYKPLVGMTALSNNNFTSYFDYDEKQRLSSVRDQHKNILKNYSYHYRRATTSEFKNVTLTISVQKNNCPNLAIGTMVDYMVPAGKYTSTISQEDADVKAQNEVAMNAQLNANQFGYCTGGIVPYKNVAMTKSFRKECPIGLTSDLIPYTVAAGAYTSPISQAQVDLLATQDLNLNGQLNANAHGICTAKVGLEWETSVSGDNQITRMRFYNQTGTTLLYDIGISDLANPYFIERGNYKIVVDVNGITYSVFEIRVTSGSTSVPFCQTRTGSVNSSSYSFESMNLTSASYLVFILGTSCD